MERGPRWRACGLSSVAVRSRRILARRLAPRGARGRSDARVRPRSSQSTIGMRCRRARHQHSQASVGAIQHGLQRAQRPASGQPGPVFMSAEIFELN